MLLELCVPISCLIPLGLFGYRCFLDLRTSFREKDVKGCVSNIFLCTISFLMGVFCFCIPFLFFYELCSTLQEDPLGTYIFCLVIALYFNVATSGLFYEYRNVFKSKLLCSWFRKMEAKPLAYGTVMTLIFMILNVALTLAYGFVLTNLF